MQLTHESDCRTALSAVTALLQFQDLASRIVKVFTNRTMCVNVDNFTSGHFILTGLHYSDTQIIPQTLNLICMNNLCTKPGTNQT